MQTNNKLRESMVQVKEIARTIYSTSETGSPHEDLAEKIVELAHAALAEPPKNCDRFASAEEAWDAYDEWVESYRAQGKTEPFNEFGWLFAKATEKEGGANG